VRDADTILVLQDGRIAARGSHEELMRDSALYAEIFSSQLQSECELMPELCEEDLRALEGSADLDSPVRPEPAGEVR